MIFYTKNLWWLIMNIKKILMIFLLSFIWCGQSLAESISDDDYQRIRTIALNYEKTLSPEVLSALNQTNGPILKKVFYSCTSLELPTSFEVVALVNGKGVVTNSWSNTPTIFGQCAARTFVGETQLSISNKAYYSILTFTLTNKAD